MNLIKLISPDFFVGKTLVAVKTIVDLVVFIAQNPSRQSLKLATVILKIKPRFTMVKSKNLINLYALVRKANAQGLADDIVECGVWNEGSAAMMGFACLDDSAPTHRSIWLFDSFSGLPPPGDKDGTMENEQYFEGLNKGSIYKVKQAFAILGVPMDLVRIVPGWFDPTLKTSTLDRIAILHIDADWYESVKFVLQALYEKVVPGGFIVLDDYGYWEGCKRALTDFFAERGIKDLSIERIGRQGVYFQKPLQGNMQRVGSIRLVL